MRLRRNWIPGFEDEIEAAWNEYKGPSMALMIMYMRLSLPIPTEIYKILPYVVTVIVLITISIRQKRENQPPASLGNAYFREDR